MKTMNRTGTLKRTTKETDIELSLKLDGTGIADIDTGIRFFDHTCIAKGDLEVDCHHTIEDTGIVLGQAIREAAGDKKGMVRFGSCILPMDEALVLCSLDLSGRPCFVSNAVFPTERVGEMDTQMVREFFYAVSYGAGMNLHFKMLSGENSHHMIECMFKAFAKALSMAVTLDPRIVDVLSTKGSL